MLVHALQYNRRLAPRRSRNGTNGISKHVLTKIMAGNETFEPPGAKENAAPLRDPCSDIIRQTLAPLQTP